MPRQLIAAALAALFAVPLPGQSFARRYSAGDSVAYHMEGQHVERTDTVRYQADARGVVARDSAGRFLERLVWTRVAQNGVASVPPRSRAAEELTLAPDWQVLPDAAKLDPRLIGPALDLFTFYVDIKLAATQQSLAKVGDRAILPLGVGGSWADGVHTVAGSDAVDFDISVIDVDHAAQTITILVRHVVPSAPKLTVPAPWMRHAANGALANWFDVVRVADGVFRARAAVETFDVRLTLSTVDGRLLLATMDNPVDGIERECRDAMATDCRDPVAYHVHRLVTVRGR